MLSNVKGFFTRAGTKGKVALSSCLVLGMTLVPTAIASADDGNVNVPGSGGLLVVPGEGEEGGEGMENIFSGVGDVIKSVVTPAATFCSGNEICLAFLSFTFVGCGIRLVRRAINAFGRGR